MRENWIRRKRLSSMMLIIAMLTVILSACGKEVENNSKEGGKKLELDDAVTACVDSFVDNNFDVNDYKLQILEYSGDRCTVEVTIVCKYNTYVDTVAAQIELSKNAQDNSWSYIRDSYTETSRIIDFSPMNGTWEAVYYHASNYLTKDKILYTFTFSNAGTIEVKGQSFEAGTITVNHELNDIWKDYLNPNFTEGMSGPMDYETGTMEIRVEEKSVANFQHARNPYFKITFSEKQNTSFFKTECVLEITAESITFADAHGARKCVLDKK